MEGPDQAKGWDPYLTEEGFHSVQAQNRFKGQKGVDSLPPKEDFKKRGRRCLTSLFPRKASLIRLMGDRHLIITDPKKGALWRASLLHNTQKGFKNYRKASWGWIIKMQILSKHVLCFSFKRLESGQRVHSLPTEHIINPFWVTSFSIEITDTLLPCERAIQ